jgi:hypothetical protein
MERKSPYISYFDNSLNPYSVEPAKKIIIDSDAGGDDA